MAGRIAVVDEQDRFIRWAPRPEIHRARLLHRSIHVFVFDAEERLLLQRRHPSKDTFPNCWDISCTGHVEESDYLGGPDERLSEVCAGTARREMSEELGVDPPLDFLGRVGPDLDVHYEIIYLYAARSDGPFTPQPDEVSALRRVSPAEFAAMRADPGTPLTNTVGYLVDWLAQTRGRFRLV